MERRTHTRSVSGTLTRSGCTPGHRPSRAPGAHVVRTQSSALSRASSRGAAPNLPLGGGQGALRVPAPRGGGPGRGWAGWLPGLDSGHPRLLAAPGTGRGGAQRQEAGRGFAEALGSEGGRGQLPEGRQTERAGPRPGAEPEPAGPEAAQPRARPQPQPRQHGRPDRAGRDPEPGQG